MGSKTKMEALLAECSQLDSKTRHDLEGKIRAALQAKEDAAREELAERESQLFWGRAPEMLQLALLKRISLEQDPVGDCEEPGQRQHFLAKNKGWIQVYKYGEASVGRSNEAIFRVPLWLEKTLAKLKEFGWECKIGNEEFCETGFGNKVMAFLWVRDPRISNQETE